MQQLFVLLVILLFTETVAEKKYCWYSDEDYPVHYLCKAYEDCCGTQCCVRALSVLRIWYYWLLLVVAILCCCSSGYFIRRRVHPYPPPEGPDLNVVYTRHPIISAGLHAGHVTAVYSALPPYYSQAPPSYDQVMQGTQK